MVLLIEEFQEQVRCKEHKTAIVDQEGNRSISYGELSELSDQIAGQISKMGIVKGSFLPILMPRQMEYIAALMGILKAGCVAVPLSGDYPLERVEYIKDKCNALVTVDEDFVKRAMEEKCAPPILQMDAKDCAFAVYTSGSTGEPKGIVHNHKNLIHAAKRLAKGIGLTAEDAYLSSTPFHFVAIIIDVFMNLITGTTIHINSDANRKDIRKIESYVTHHDITALYLSPQMLKLFHAQGSKVRLVLTGSERVTNISGAEYELYNLYGSSETMPPTTYFKVDRAYENTPIGKPFDGMSVYLLTDEGALAKQGEVGEICIAGPVAEGYLNQPEETRRVFVKNPFATGDEDRILYHSHDLGKFLPDGNLVYVNRKDWMVKINGQRVETGEIEAQMHGLDYIRTAVVKGFENQYGQTYLCAYFQLKEGRQLEAPQQEIKKALKKKLPTYMIPSFFVQMESIPLNQNGKINRVVLEAPDTDSFRKEYKAPQTNEEKLLCQAFETVLNISPIGCTDDFFALGGDSIKVLLLQEQCENLPLTSMQIFEGKTPKKIASLLQEEVKKDIYKGVQKGIAGVRPRYPLTQSQLGVLMECIQHPQSLMYNMPFCLQAPADVNAATWREALLVQAKCYPVLLGKIEEKEGAYGMVPSAERAIEIPIHEVSEADMQAIKKQFTKPFRLMEDVLCRMEIYKTPEHSYLLFDMHHIISDGTSVAAFLAGAAQVYNGGKPIEEELSQYDVALCEETLVDAKYLELARAYFEKCFAGNEVNSNLLFDYTADQNADRYPAKRVCVNMGEYLGAKEIEQFVAGEGITENSFFLGTFAYALAKYTGQAEAMFCTVNNGRHNQALKSTMGMLVKTLPVYTAVDEEMHIAEYLEQVQKNFFETMSYDCISFRELSLEYNINADIRFVYQAEMLNSVELQGFEIPMEILDTGDAQANITVHIFKKKGSYEMLLEYRSDLYAEHTIKTFSHLILCVIEGFLNERQLKNITLVSEADLRMLDTFHGKQTPFDKSKTVVHVFDDMVREYPQYTAVIYKEKSYTYREVDQLSRCAASYLNQAEIGKGAVVSVLLSRSEYMPIASMAVMKSGAAYQPLDPTYPKERLAFMMKDANVSLLIADEDLLELVPEYEGAVLLTKNIPNLQESEEILENPSPEDTFILLYTSGTTGNPKGCMLTHQNLAAYCEWYRTYFQTDATSVVSAYASFGFDACMMEMYGALTSGATLCIVPEEIRLELHKLNAYFEEKHVTHAFMTTQVGRQFAEEIENKSLKCLLTGGEALVPVKVRSDFDFFNCYGPTECTVMTMVYKIDKSRTYENMPIGKPLDNLKVYVTDKQMRQLPVGAVGELCVSGYQVSRGYLNRPEQTAKAYEDNHFTNCEGYERIYHTGDDVRFQSNGEIQFLGRRDGQVKIRGFRIELTEVEAVIRRYPGIQDVAVIAYDAAAGGKAIAAYIVSEQTVEIQELKDFIMEEKPTYMVPTVLMQIDKIPLNQNMKVNRRALPDPLSYKAKSAPAKARVMTHLEKELKVIAEKLLGHGEFEVDENLLQVGLSSLSAIQLAVEVEKVFHVSLEVKEMMRSCSLLSMEDAIYQALLAKGESEEKGGEVNKEEQRGHYPLTQSQLGVYYDCIKHPQEMGYNIPAAVYFPLSVTADQLKEAVEIVVQAHPYLNVGICEQNGQIVQVPFGHNIIVERMSLTESEFKDYKQNFVRPFDITGEALCRIVVVDTLNKVCLLTDFHHMIFDGASMNLFLKQVASACEGNLPRKESYSYFDASLTEQEETGKENYQAAKQYYANLLSDFEQASELTKDIGNAGEIGKRAEIVLPFNMALVTDFCHTYGVTAAHLFLAGACYTLCRYTGSKNVFLCTISNGRTDLNVQESVGMFVKTLPLAASIEGDKTVLAFVEEAKTAMLEAIKYEEYPFTQLSSDYGFTPHIMYACQLGVLEEIVVQKQPLQIESLESDNPKFKLSIHIEERDKAPSVCVAYNNAIYSSDIVESLTHSIIVCVEQMINNAQMALKKLSLVTEEQSKVLEGYCMSAQNVPKARLFHEAFEKQVDMHGEQIALIAKDGTFNYKELDRKMNRIANALHNRGFGNGDTAAILLNRDSRQIMAMYGVMKAGGAYIPCDPDYPVDRIRQITEDSGASVILTTNARMAEYENAVDIEELLSCENEQSLNSLVGEDDLAYMIYTSGSTGKPKGVMLTHRGIVNYVQDHAENIHVHACVKDGNVMVSVTTVSFDMSLKETAVALCNGLTLVLADEDKANNPVHLAELMKETKGDIFNATPSRMLQYLEAPEFVNALKQCKIVMSGGEAYSLNLLHKLQKVTKARIFNTYGPTEITVSSNAKELTREDRITIGRPLPNYTEYVVDSDGNLLPPGVTGELYVGGPGVARGYHGLKEMTEERFLSFAGQRVYKTGDYARWTSNGEIVILGRTDNQVKLRGLRIELEEVENAIITHPLVNQVVVVIRKIYETEHLCAYYTAQTEVSGEELKEMLKKSLTHYMIPTAYIKMEALPMTPNGKIDRKVLPTPELTGAGKYTAPINEDEETFCHIFEQVLNLEQVGRTDDFFDWGGTSLMVTSVIISATKAGYDITYGDVFSHPTPQALAQLFCKEEPISSGLEDLSQYDYSRITQVLTGNTFEAFKTGVPQPLGNVLLTGTTGFLGIHILREFLENETGTIYCILRKGAYDSAIDRLKSTLFYYFENTYEELIGNRILVAEGDVTDKTVFDRLTDTPIDTVINCAANVKHFSSGTDIEDVNVGGVLHAIDFCKMVQARLVHISTTSVSGFSVGDIPPADMRMTEQMLYFGQILDTKYGHSKFLAERAILEEAADGMNVKIMRVGNLSARDTDGEFQINSASNSFVGRLKSYEVIGKFPYSLMEVTAEMAPIDSTAKAILALSKTPKACCLFQPYNNHSIYMGDIIYGMKDYGMEIELTENEQYEKALMQAQADPEKAAILSSMIAYQNMGHGKKTVPIARNNDFTMQVLYRLQYHWPTTSREYVEKFVTVLAELKFF